MYLGARCTSQLTSDHGWDLVKDAEQLRPVIAELKAAGIRVSLFVDYQNPHLAQAKTLGADRVELYTEPYAETFGTAENAAILQGFLQATQVAQAAGLGVNAGHDLNLDNLAHFLKIPDILEVSIGHAVIVESLELGVEKVVSTYADICHKAA